MAKKKKQSQMELSLDSAEQDIGQKDFKSWPKWKRDFLQYIMDTPPSKRSLSLRETSHATAPSKGKLSSDESREAS